MFGVMRGFMSFVVSNLFYFIYHLVMKNKMLIVVLCYLPVVEYGDYQGDNMTVDHKTRPRRYLINFAN